MAEVAESAAPPVAVSQVDVDPTFSRMLQAMREYSQAAEIALTTGSPGKWCMLPLASPETGVPAWDGNLFAADQLGIPFSRRTVNNKVTDAVKTAAQPGTGSDLSAGTTQIDYLACAQRAFIARHGMRRIRSTLHAAARARAYGSERGIFAYKLPGWISELVRQGKTT